MNTGILARITGTTIGAVAATLSASGIEPVVVATSGMEAPGTLGEFFNTTNMERGTLAEGGIVAFRSRIFDALPAVERGVWRGPVGGLQLIMRDGDQAAGMASGITYNSLLGGNVATGVRDPRITSGGGMLLGTRLWSTTGQITANVNDSALYYVPSNSNTPTLLAQRGVTAVSGGAVINTSVESLTPIGVNDAGQTVIKATLLGGDVVGTTNNEAIVGLHNGSVFTMARKGDATPIGGGTTFNGLGFARQINEAGQFAFDATLSGATTADDNAIFRGDFSGGPLTLLAREGQQVTVDGAVLSGSIQPTTVGFNKHGKAAFASAIAGGTSTANDNQGIFVADGNTIDFAVRKGISAVGTDGIASVIFNSDVRFNDRNDIAYRVALSGGTVDTTNDNALYFLHNGVTHLVAREGDFIPELGGTISGTIGSAFINNVGDLAFTATIAGSSITNSALLHWDMATGLSVVTFRGQVVEVVPGVFRTIGSVGFDNQANGMGRSTGLSDDRNIHWSTTYIEGGQGLFIAAVPAPGVLGLFGIAGLAAARRRR